MSRPIFSRPRTRVYGCNYDKGESYYKPMVDHLDRKYSSRPLFSEPRTSFADEIAARRSDIVRAKLPRVTENDAGPPTLSTPATTTTGRGWGVVWHTANPTVLFVTRSRGDQSAAQSSLRDLDLEFDLPRGRGKASKLQDNEDETVYDIRGQRIKGRRSMADDFTSEVASTTRRFRAALDTSIGIEDHHLQSNTAEYEASKNARLAAKSAFDEAENSFKRRSKLLNDVDAFDRLGEDKSALTKWSKFANEEDLSSIGISSAAGRAKQTKARLNDLETEMEEMAERQAKRERRSAALRALVNEAATSSSDEQLQQSSLSSKRLTVRTEKHVNF